MASRIVGGSEPGASCGPTRRRRHHGTNGFTLIELLVVMAIIAVLLTLAVPRYFQGIEASKETVLHENLRIMRETIDKFYADAGRYPDSLTELVDKKYLRAIPIDPVAGPTAEWKILPPDDPDQGKVYDVKSNAPGSDRHGTRYADY
ncbi:type II secretion system protein [Burkholderia sp. Ac-20353]|uniref:type II secretion system protein n=1 Tax=Burkholderia sp. Ac-20353 TaxID=2703894 RepID=UPI00197BC526|nr:type II secretion system protein [Burkholderia sp. Ac-20353]MBN3788932.1 type II secretion system protein [Burkholderia sp. Ac-20353]